LNGPRTSWAFPEALDRIARSSHAAFARDSGERIILWNKKCEELFGRPARSVLGKHCHDVTGGRDCFGNVYCHHNCPIAFQACDRSDPVRRFTLRAETKGGPKWFEVGTFAIPSYHPALSTMVHVFSEGRAKRQSPAERLLAGNAPAPEPLSIGPPGFAGDQPSVLTPRETEVLKLLAQGMTTPAIAAELFISPVTVRNHVAAILNKLDVHSKLAAVIFAYRQRLV
jgi:Response regulator containing a CheY-like receiver domain and an HTH DNA-binding domain